MNLETRTPRVELQNAIAHELNRLASVAKDIETHLEDALHSKTLQEETVTGIQQIDAMAQILEQLSALIGRASEAYPLSPVATEKLIADVALVSLQHRLQGGDSSTCAANDNEVDFF